MDIGQSFCQSITQKKSGWGWKNMSWHTEEFMIIFS